MGYFDKIHIYDLFRFCLVESGWRMMNFVVFSMLPLLFQFAALNRWSGMNFWSKKLFWVNLSSSSFWLKNNLFFLLQENKLQFSAWLLHQLHVTSRLEESQMIIQVIFISTRGGQPRWPDEKTRETSKLQILIWVRCTNDRKFSMTRCYPTFHFTVNLVFKTWSYSFQPFWSFHKVLVIQSPESFQQSAHDEVIRQLSTYYGIALILHKSIPLITESDQLQQLTAWAD
jgi:hypothetical protein